jgi:hypothetical protein
VQPKVQPDPQVEGAVAGQVPGGQERPRERRGDDGAVYEFEVTLASAPHRTTTRSSSTAASPAITAR